MRVLAGILAAAAVSAAQEPPVLWTAMPGPVEQAVADVPPPRPVAVREWTGAATGGWLVALEARRLRELAAGDRLRPLGLPDRSGEEPPLQLLCWRVPYVMACRRGGEEPPGTIGNVLWDGAWDGRLVLPEPGVAPALWNGWVAEQTLRRQGNLEIVLAWLRRLDGRVLAYEPDLASVVRRVAGGGVLGVLPRHRVPEGAVGRTLPGLPARHGIGRLGGPEPREAPGLAVWLAGAPFREAVARHAGLDPLPAGDAPVAVDEELRTDWLPRWRREVRGRGREYERLDSILEVVLGGVFLIILVFVYLKVRRSDDSRATTP